MGIIGFLPHILVHSSQPFCHLPDIPPLSPHIFSQCLHNELSRPQRPSRAREHTRRTRNGKTSPLPLPLHCQVTDFIQSAYIAASRRSDRSLEARVESARRASEIHKKRTGRSLRVTEQDVVNEEMYEEEDDEMPLQYKRLTAHLQTGSADFNKRLSNYLANHVAMRSALDQAITASYAQQYPNAPQFAHNNQIMYPSPFSSPITAPNTTEQQSLQSFVQSPYNTATGTPSYRPVHHFRASSIQNPQHLPGYQQAIPNSSPVQRTNDRDQRRMSTPVKSQSPQTSSQGLQSSNSGKSPTSPTQSADKHAQTPGQMQPPPQPAIQALPQQQRRPYANLGSYADYSPFTTTSLPTETQMMIGPGYGLDPNDHLTSMFMAGSESFPQPFYNSNQLQFHKARNAHPSYDAMSATLSPSALDMPPHDDTLTPASVSYSNNLDVVNELSKDLTFTRSNSSHGSGTGTPSLSNQDWNNFINQDSWTENGT